MRSTKIHITVPPPKAGAPHQVAAPEPAIAAFETSRTAFAAVGLLLSLATMSCAVPPTVRPA